MPERFASPDSGLTLVRADSQPYQVPFSSPWQSAQGIHRVRRGFLLRLKTAPGLHGYGECAPLPEAGTETLAAATAVLRSVLPGCIGRSVAEVAACLDDLADTPAVRCALETALLDICAREQSLPLYRWLVPDATACVFVNAACGCLDEGFAARLDRAIGAGYRVVKIKLGVFPLQQEMQALQRLQLPASISLRLDVNRAWSAGEAMRAIEACARLPVESLEEPLQSPDPKLLRSLQQQAPFPLALDESLADLFVDTPVADLPVRRLVLKPTVLGGVLPVLRRARRARQVGIDTLITSTLETSVGLWAAVHGAAALGSPLAHGLGTATWFERPDPALCPRQGLLDPGSWTGPGLPHPAW